MTVEAVVSPRWRPRVAAWDNIDYSQVVACPALAKALGECRVSLGTMTGRAAPTAGEHKVERLACLQELLVALIRLKVLLDG